MYNGRFKSFTYGADGQLALNNERQWGDSIVNNNAEHFSVQSKIKNFKSMTDSATSQIEYFQTNNKQQAGHLDFLSKKLNVYNELASQQENFYSGMLKEQFSNYRQLSNQQDKLCNSALNKQYTNLSEQQNLLQKQQNALEYFENLHQSQVNSNHSITQKNRELVSAYPEHFEMDNTNAAPSTTTGSGAAAPPTAPGSGAAAPPAGAAPKTAPVVGAAPNNATATTTPAGAAPSAQMQQAKKCLNDKYESLMQKCKWTTTGLQSFDSEDAALNACNADNNCKGYATPGNNKWYLYNPMEENSCEKGEQSYCKRR
jgi:hypothetical protein